MLFGCVIYFLLFLHIVHIVTAPFVERPTLFSMDCLSLFLSMLCFVFIQFRLRFSFFFDLRLSVNVLFSFQIFWGFQILLGWENSKIWSIVTTEGVLLLNDHKVKKKSKLNHLSWGLCNVNVGQLHKSLKPSYFFFIFLFVAVYDWMNSTALSLSLLIVVLHLVCCWTHLLHFSVELLYFSALRFLFGTLLCFLSLEILPLFTQYSPDLREHILWLWIWFWTQFN